MKGCYGWMGLAVDVDCLWIWLIECLLWLDGTSAMVGWNVCYGGIECLLWLDGMGGMDRAECRRTQCV